MTKVDNEETSALYAALDSLQEEFSELFDNFANLTLHGQEDGLNLSNVYDALQLYLSLLQKIREI